MSEENTIKTVSLDFDLLYDLREKLELIKNHQTFKTISPRANAAEAVQVHTRNMEYALYNLDCLLGMNKDDYEYDLESQWKNWTQMKESTQLTKALEAIGEHIAELVLEKYNNAILIYLINVRTFLRKELDLIES